METPDKPAQSADKAGKRARDKVDPVQSVARALELLDALQRREQMTIGELAELHGVHRATTLRLLQTLERFGYVSRGETRGQFRLGLKLYELGALFGERHDLLRAARPIMRHLAAATGETIDLALFDDGETVILESIAERPLRRVGSPAGRRAAASCTTTGKLHLASLPVSDVDAMIAARGLPRLGPKSITDRAHFLTELARVRALGYAINDEESDARVRFIGVPINLPGIADQRQRPSLILGAPVDRLPTSSFPRVAHLLHEAAGRIADVA